MLINYVPRNTDMITAVQYFNNLSEVVRILEFYGKKVYNIKTNEENNSFEIKDGGNTIEVKPYDYICIHADNSIDIIDSDTFTEKYVVL